MGISLQCLSFGRDDHITKDKAASIIASKPIEITAFAPISGFVSIKMIGILTPLD